MYNIVMDTQTIDLKTLTSIDEKISLFNGSGNWRTNSANGKLPQLVMSDGPHGLRKQETDTYANLNESNIATCFPTASCAASSWDKELLKELGGAIATEARAENVHLVLGPGLNIKRSPLCGRNFEYFSEDPLLAGQLATEYVKGMQEKGVGACLKHFACNNQEKRRQTASSNVDERTLRKIYLQAFERVVKNADPAAIMCSYNKINGTWVPENSFILNQILKQEWGFNGAVISDWGACLNAPESLKAGMDLAMPDSFGYIFNQLKNAYQNGKITEEDLDKANSRVLNLIKKYSKPRSEETVDYSKQHAIALKIAEQSAVLLKNDGLLPLKKQKILVLGELAKNMKFQGGGSSHINCKKYPDAVESLIAQGYEVEYIPGYFSGFCKKSKIQKKNAPLLKAAINKAKEASKQNIPILIFAGLTESYEGEGFDRQTLSLPAEQIELISEVLKLTNNVIVVSFSGAPIDLMPAIKAGALLHMYLCGEACGEAVADLISGKANPCGKLAETWPLSIEDTPCFGNFGPDGDDVNYDEGELVGYRWYNHKNIPVQFKFGYGLSYTAFETSLEKGDKARIENNKIFLDKFCQEISVKVKNTGDCSGAEVVQIYSSGELVGFEKVFLEGGEEKVVTVKNEQNNYDEYSSEKNVVSTSKGEFTINSSLGDMAKKCLQAKIVADVMKLALVIINKKSPEDPSVKIQISAIEENPLASLISITGGKISENFARKLVKAANKANK